MYYYYDFFNRYGIFKVFNVREHEKPRICLLFEIITQQPWRNRKTLAARIFDLHCAPHADVSSLNSRRRRFAAGFKVRRRRSGVIFDAPALLKYYILYIINFICF